MKTKHIACHIALAGMFLGIYRGQLALWKEHAATPEEIYPCRICTLPEADRLLLEDGIPIRSRQELTARLEDLLS